MITPTAAKRRQIAPLRAVCPERDHLQFVHDRLSRSLTGLYQAMAEPTSAVQAKVTRSPATVRAADPLNAGNAARR